MRSSRHSPLYARLKRLLADYRLLAAQPAIVLPPLPSARGKIVAGDIYAGVPALQAQLVRLRDLAADARTAGGRPVHRRAGRGGSALPGAARPAAGRRSGQGDPRRTERAARRTGGPDHAVARTAALAAGIAAGAADRDQHPFVPALGIRRCRCGRARDAVDAGRGRQGGAHGDAGLHRRDALRRVQPVLERAAQHPAQRNPAPARNRSVLRQARGHGSREHGPRRPGAHARSTTRRSRRCGRARRACASGREPEMRWAASSSCCRTR